MAFSVGADPGERTCPGHHRVPCAKDKLCGQVDRDPVTADPCAGSPQRPAQTGPADSDAAIHFCHLWPGGGAHECGAAATAACAPLNIAAATCAPLGALVGEAIYAQIPDIVDMIVANEDKYNPVPDSGDKRGAGTTPPRVSFTDGDGGSTDDSSNNTMLYLIGGSVAGFLLYKALK